MSNFTNVSVTGITVPEQPDAFNEDMANALLILLRGDLGQPDTSKDWQYDAFAFIRAQDNGLGQFFGTVEYQAAAAVAANDALDMHHFSEDVVASSMVIHEGETVFFGLELDVTLIGQQALEVLPC